MNIEVGSCEAKTKLPDLLRGEAAADLGPAQGNKQVSTAVDDMHAFMLSRKPDSLLDLKALMDEGRA